MAQNQNNTTKWLGGSAVVAILLIGLYYSCCGQSKSKKQDTATVTTSACKHDVNVKVDVNCCCKCGQKTAVKHHAPKMKHVAPPAPKAPAPVPVAAAPAPAPEPEVTIVKAKIREPRESEDDRPRRTERYENNIPVQPAPRPGREWNGYTWVIVEQRQQYWEPRPRIEYGGRRCAPQPPPYRPQVWGSGGRVWNPSRPGGGPQNPPTGGSNGGPQNPPTGRSWSGGGPANPPAGIGGRSWSGGGPANPPAGMSGGRQVFQGSQRGGRR